MLDNRVLHEYDLFIIRILKITIWFYLNSIILKRREIYAKWRT
jgi:hypothetical protein